MKAIQEMQRRNKTALIRDLKKVTTFTNQELGAIYDAYKGALSLDSYNHCLYASMSSAPTLSQQLAVPIAWHHPSFLGVPKGAHELPGQLP